MCIYIYQVNPKPCSLFLFKGVKGTAHIATASHFGLYSNGHEKKTLLNRMVVVFWFQGVKGTAHIAVNLKWLTSTRVGNLLIIKAN